MKNKSSALLCLAIVMVLVLGCTCSDDILSEAISPNEKRVAATFVRNCGATTGYVTHVAVRWRSSEQTDQDLVFTVHARQEVKLEWLNDHILRLSCPNCTDDLVGRRVTKLGGVTILYDEASRDE